jgi:hypothetical protein
VRNWPSKASRRRLEVFFKQVNEKAYPVMHLTWDRVSQVLHKPGIRGDGGQDEYYKEKENRAKK